MQIKRQLNLHTLLKKKSHFLFGPRQTGKSSLITHDLPQFKQYTLLDSNTYSLLQHNPKYIEQSLNPNDKIIIIDEIQKIPNLLDEVHLLIEKYGIHFLLTGSSARKLRRGGVNLLGGRARSKTLHPFILNELEAHFELKKALSIGLIPGIYFSDSPYEDLKAYTNDYLKEEIASEALSRNIPAFSRFLHVAAHCHGNIINYTKISNDAQIPNSTVQNYFQILKDTLIAYEIPAWKKSEKRKPINTSKFYFFDIGVVRSLQHRKELHEGSPEFGDAFESYIAHELKTYCDYIGIDDLHYWRSTSGFEVDFILDNRIAIEVKAKKIVSPNDLKGLKAIMEENKLDQYIVLSLETSPRKMDNINILPWDHFLNNLWH